MSSLPFGWNRAELDRHLAEQIARERKANETRVRAAAAARYEDERRLKELQERLEKSRQKATEERAAAAIPSDVTPAELAAARKKLGI